MASPSSSSSRSIDTHVASIMGIASRELGALCGGMVECREQLSNTRLTSNHHGHQLRGTWVYLQPCGLNTGSCHLQLLIQAGHFTILFLRRSVCVVKV
jgi:hypothetical protein